MIREAPTANRYVQEAENERQYQKHVNAIKNMKPSINTHADIKNKDLKSRNPRVRIFNGQTALNNGNQPMATTGLRKEKISEKNDRRPKTAMNYINLEINLESDNENEVFSARTHKKKIDNDLCSISESSSGLLDSSNKKKQNIDDNSSSPEKKDITEFDIFSIQSSKSQAEKEREELTTNIYHPYIPTNSAKAKTKTANTEIQQQPLPAKKSRIPLSRQDNANHNNGNNSAGQGMKKISPSVSNPKNTVSNAKSKIKVKTKTEKNINTNSEDTDTSSTTNVAFKPQKVSSARRKIKNDNNNHPHMTQMDKQQMQAQQRRQQRILKQQQEKLERQERLEKLEKQKKKISTNPSSSQLQSSPSTPVINKSNKDKTLKSPNISSNSSLANKKQPNDLQIVKNENTKRFFQTEISLSKTKTKAQNTERLSKTDNNNDDILLPCQPLLSESSPKVTFGADMWDTSDDEDEYEKESENITTDTEKENTDQFEIKKDKSSFSDDIDYDINEKHILSDDIESNNGIKDDFVCSDDFSSDNDF